jgi:hypothetical protein
MDQKFGGSILTDYQSDENQKRRLWGVFFDIYENDLL